MQCSLCPQSTVVVERWWKVPLSKVGSPPRLHPRRHRIYKLVEDTKHSPTPKMELILSQTVPSESQRAITEMLGFCFQMSVVALLKYLCVHFTDRAWRTRRHGFCKEIFWKKQAAASRPCCVSITREQEDICRGVKGVCLCVRHI